MRRSDCESAGLTVADLVYNKNWEYSDAYPKVAELLKILFPDGIKPELYPVLPKIERTLEKLCRYDGKNPGKDTALDLCGIWLNQVIEDMGETKNDNQNV